MTVANDWAKLSEELEVIKRDAYHEGYQKAMDDFGDSKTKHEAALVKLREEIHAWHRIIYQVQETWAKHTNQPARWVDPSTHKHHYQPLFPAHHERVGEHYVNMPDDLDHFVMAMDQCIKMAADFKMLLAEFEKNPIVKAQWDRLLVAMKMTEE